MPDDIQWWEADCILSHRFSWDQFKTNGLLHPNCHEHISQFPLLIWKKVVPMKTGRSVIYPGWPWHCQPERDRFSNQWAKQLKFQFTAIIVALQQKSFLNTCSLLSAWLNRGKKICNLGESKPWVCGWCHNFSLRLFVRHLQFFHWHRSQCGALCKWPHAVHIHDLCMFCLLCCCSGAVKSWF